MAPAFILLILITLSYGKREFCHQYCNCSDTSRLKFISCDSSKYNTTEIQSFVDKNGFHIVKFINSSLTHVQLKSDSLLTLQLNSNNLSSRYVSINCKNLKHLYLGDNYLDKGIFTCLENLTSLMELDLSENSIKVIDNQILINSPNLEVINLEGNYIQIIRRNYFNVRTNLIKLNLKKNKLKHIDKFSFVKLSSLQELYLDENIFSTLTKNIFSGLASLRILSISKCNRLRKIEPSTFHNLIGLQNMNLSFNKNLKNLPRRLLHDSKDLSVMDIQTSSLSSLSYDIVDQTCCSNSTKLIISGNFLRCDCRLRWMKVSLFFYQFYIKIMYKI